ncbi:TIR domain-containing protein [Robinsoniella peoriensis]|uniref:TIR domain-containing protein n=1 Tax=Robinsoniella peoriensis TaxID=180332 RepID=UPI00363BE8AA
MNRTGNYCAFYVKEPFSETNLGANTAHDFCYYNTLRMWKGKDSTFPFVDSHNKNYSVRDGSSWETLRDRLRERLRGSKNIILFLSSNTIESKALKEELEYGMNTQSLPVIVIYPAYNEKTDIANSEGIKQSIKNLWDKVPTFKKYMSDVATIHVPMKQSLITSALKDEDVMVNTMKKGTFFYKIQ